MCTTSWGCLSRLVEEERLDLLVAAETLDFANPHTSMHSYSILIRWLQLASSQESSLVILDQSCSQMPPRMIRQTGNNKTPKVLVRIQYLGQSQRIDNKPSRYFVIHGAREKDNSKKGTSWGLYYQKVTRPVRPCLVSSVRWCCVELELELEPVLTGSGDVWPRCDKDPSIHPSIHPMPIPLSVLCGPSL